MAAFVEPASVVRGMISFLAVVAEVSGPSLPTLA
jgi:hypothetical protein